MGNTLTCLVCDGDLAVLPDTHPEYSAFCITDDGTRKWFTCNDCQAVCIKDKVSGKWYLSAKTYDRLVASGEIKDRLKT